MIDRAADASSEVTIASTSDPSTAESAASEPGLAVITSPSLKPCPDGGLNESMPSSSALSLASATVACSAFFARSRA